MKKIFNIRKKAIYILLLVLTVSFIIFLSLSYKTVRHYHHYVDRMIGWNLIFADTALEPKKLDLKRFVLTFKHVVKFELQKKTSRNLAKESELASFYLSIDKSKLKELNSNLPISGKKYKKGFMKYDDNPEIFKVKIRYRGNMPNHWMYEKKSFRVKMKRSANLNISREFNLINIDTYKSSVDLVTYKIAKEEGIISPNFYPVRVFINGEFYGVYFYLDQTKEQLLRLSNRMPGSIYQEFDADYFTKIGDTSFSSINEEGVGKLWEEEANWQKIASRNAEKKEDRSDIKYIINAIVNFDEIEFYNFVNKYINKETYYKYFAIDVLTGTLHHTYVHNHKLYFDPYKGKYEPIEWDVRFWGYGKEVKDVSHYQLLNRIRLNPILAAQRDKVIYYMINKYSPKILADRYKDETNKFIVDLAGDKFRRDLRYGDEYGSHYEAYPISKFKDFIKTQERDLKKRSDFLKGLYNTVDARFKIQSTQEPPTKVDGLIDGKTPDNSGGINRTYKQNKITFEVGGNNSILIEKEKLLLALGVKKLYFDKNLNNKFDDREIVKDKIIHLYPAKIIKEGSVLGSDTAIIRKLFGNIHIGNHPEYYTFFFHGDANIPKNLEVVNFANDKMAVINNQDFKKNHGQASSIHPWKLLFLHKEKKVVYQGVVRINSLVEHDEYTDVIIRPGTKFVMGKGSSIISYGRVIAKGTQQEPISFVASNRKEPWGVFAIQGKYASNSVFENIKFEDGSILNYNLIDYTAPLNIHNVDNFKVSNCIFERNYIGDDMVHIAYSKGVIKDSKFISARSDALDIDISKVELYDNEFINSGNDAIDSMTSEVIIARNKINGAGDKCVSVGERSSGIYSDNVFNGCNIGIAVKDESEIYVNNTIISNSKSLAISIYRKNMYYNDAGRIHDNGIKFEGNDIVSKQGFDNNYIKNN